MAKAKTINIGEKYNLLTVVGIPFTGANGLRCVECRCDCGNTTTPRASHVLRGSTKSCGCVYKSFKRVGNRSHGKSNTGAFRSYWAMKTRCLNPKARSYKSYGGRGISICEFWLFSFENFVADMGERPDGTTLDRIDVNGNYENSNCRWATSEQQVNNKCDSHFLVFDGKEMTIAQWTKATGFGQGVIETRLKLGWTIAKALSIAPVKGRNQYSAVET